MHQTVTAKVKVADASAVLDKTMEVFSKAVQYCIDTAWEHDLYTRRDIHDACYDDIREVFDLHSQLTCNAISQAHEVLKGLHRRTSKKPRVKQDFSIRYNFPRCASVSGDWGELSLATVKGRKTFNITIPACYEQYLDWDLRESLLVKDGEGRFFFCFTFAKEVSIEVSGDSHILGVDLGVNKVAVTSDGDFFGEDVKEKRTRRDRLVAELQSKGTRGAMRRLKEYGSTWKRFMHWKNHTISRSIVDKLSKGDVTVMEHLKHIRETAHYNEWVHKWSFRDLQQKIEYKATLKGIRVVYADPSNTSKRCSNCGSLNTSRRGEHQGFFTCHECGYTLDADLNASRNLAHTYMVTLGVRVACKPAHDTRVDDSKGTFRAIAGDITRKPLPQSR